MHIFTAQDHNHLSGDDTGGTVSSLVRKEAECAPYTGEVPSVVHSVLRQPGRPLDAGIQKTLIRRFGYDFGSVRVHDDTRAAASARAVHAKAHTIGSDIVFGEGQFRPGSPDGMQLLGHELAHVVQQGSTGIQVLLRQGVEGVKKEEKKEDDTGKVVVDTVKTIYEGVKLTPHLKKLVLDKPEEYAKKKWDQLEDKGVFIGWSVLAYSSVAVPMLTTARGRSYIESINVAAPLQLIPYSPVSGFTLLPQEGSGAKKGAFVFETSFRFDDYLKLLGRARKELSDLSLSLDLQWSIDPGSDKPRVLGAQAELGIIPGLTVSGGLFKGPLAPLPETHMSGAGQVVQSRKQIPEDPRKAGLPERPDARVMVTIDLMKLSESDLGRTIGRLLTGKKP